MVMLTLPQLSTNLAVLDRLAEVSFGGRVTATAKFPDEAEALRQAGATTVFNFYAEAGASYAAHVTAEGS